MKIESYLTDLNRSVYFELIEGQGVPIVFLNGLSDSFDEWKKVTSLTNLSRPLLFVDLIGQGRSLHNEFASGEQYNFRISLDEQGRCLCELLEHLQIDEYSLVGFSYGGGLALWMASEYPEKINELILFLPFLLRLDLAFPLSRVFHFQYDLMKKFTPSILHAPFMLIEKSYERFVHDYMHFRFADRIDDAHYREAAVQISEGIMNFNVFEILEKLPDSKLQLVSSDLDTLIPKSLIREFWSRLPINKKKSWTRITNGQHLILDQNPAFCADLLLTLLNQNGARDVIENHVTMQDFKSEKDTFSA